MNLNDSLFSPFPIKKKKKMLFQSVVKSQNSAFNLFFIFFEKGIFSAKMHSVPTKPGDRGLNHDFLTNTRIVILEIDI